MNTQSPSSRKPTEPGRLRFLAHRLLDEGKLPLGRPTHQSIGKSSGCTCALCHGAILEPAIEYTLEFAADKTDIREAQTLHFHAFCHRIWEAERRALKGEERMDSRALTMTVHA